MSESAELILSGCDALCLVWAVSQGVPPPPPPPLRLVHGEHLLSCCTPPWSPTFKPRSPGGSLPSLNAVFTVNTYFRAFGPSSLGLSTCFRGPPGGGHPNRGVHSELLLSGVPLRPASQTTSFSSHRNQRIMNLSCLIGFTFGDTPKEGVHCEHLCSGGSSAGTPCNNFEVAPYVLRVLVCTMTGRETPTRTTPPTEPPTSILRK